jgi:transcriptional regulator with XRE-family HTH domain
MKNHLDQNETRRLRTIGLQIGLQRKKKGLTIEQLAERIAMSPNTLQKLEAPGTEKGVSLRTLFRICDVLEIPIDRLFTNIDE